MGVSPEAVIDRYARKLATEQARVIYLELEVESLRAQLAGGNTSTGGSGDE